MDKTETKVEVVSTSAPPEIKEKEENVVSTAAPPKTNEKEENVMPKVPDLPHDYDTKKYENVVALIDKHRAQYSSRIVDKLVEEHRAQFVVDEARQVKLPLNLMGDSVLHEVIARRKTDLAVARRIKTDLAVAIIDGLNSNEVNMFRPKNYYGDTPLHIAAAVGDSKVAEALLKKHKELARERNRKGETPLHKAVQCGHFDLFFSIIKWHGDRSIAYDRTGDGSTILHYAIMSNHPDGALRIAELFPEMIQTRNSAGATPLQIMVAFLKKPSELGIFESLLYKLNFTCGKITSTKAWKTPDEESGQEDEESGDQEVESLAVLPLQNNRYLPTDLQSNHQDKSENEGNLWSCMTGWWRQWWIVKQLRIRIEEESKQAMNMKLVQVLAQPPNVKKQNESFEFYFKGFNCDNKSPMMASNAGDGKSITLEPPAVSGNTTTDVSSNTSDPAANAGSAADGKEKALLRRLADELVSSMMSGADGSATMRELVKSISRALEDVSDAKDRRIWHESPLITGVKLGHDDFVIKILEVCPQSATYVGCDGMNVLQTAVKYDRRKVVKAIKDNERLPSWLFTDLESHTKNTLLHIAAADKSIQNEADNPLRLHKELVGFELVKEIVPEELWNYRNEAEKTAREVFDEKHEVMLKDCRAQLAETGKACAPLVAAAVFTSSFYDIRRENNWDSDDQLAYKVFSYVYVFAFSCAATSLVMFLLLMARPFKQRDFRKVVPWHYLMAYSLLVMSLGAFILAFACNMTLQIYGGQRKSHADLETLLFDLVLIGPFLICFLALCRAGASWRYDSFIGRLTK